MGTFKRVCFELSALDRFDDDLIEAGVTTIELEAFPALETHNASWYYWVCLNSMMLLSNFILDSEVINEMISKLKKVMFWIAIIQIQTKIEF